MLGLGVYLAFALVKEDGKTFLPGETTHGHHQIELACSSCHTEPFASSDALQSACERCHAEELRRGKDSHPKSKFTDPRNAARVEVLDAQRCVTCHVEHRPEWVASAGVTLPKDFCRACHEDVADERESHRGMAFDTCASVGCHNFHDNRALYEDFVAKHLDEPVLHDPAIVPLRTGTYEERSKARIADAPESVPNFEHIVAEWSKSVHSFAGVTCTGCHRDPDVKDGEASFRLQASSTRCGDCHEEELAGFTTGKHGMRSAVSLPPLRPREARLPMHASAHERELTCTSCHDAHRSDVRTAASDACLTCHSDDHSLAYRGSPHGLAWELERAGVLAPGGGVSCATCHLPRVMQGEMVRVEHNQNENLRPREKMLRDVCLNCHGLSFAIDALADDDLVRSNFTGAPRETVRTPEMVRSRLEVAER